MQTKQQQQQQQNRWTIFMYLKDIKSEYLLINENPYRKILLLEEPHRKLKKKTNSFDFKWLRIGHKWLSII